MPEGSSQGIHIWIKNADPSRKGFLDAKFMFDLIMELPGSEPAFHESRNIMILDMSLWSLIKTIIN